MVEFSQQGFFERRVIRYLDAVLTNSEYMVNLLTLSRCPTIQAVLYRDGLQQVQFQPKPIDLSRRISLVYET
jgi:hypothetical protein